jgi:hypothetical protein
MAEEDFHLHNYVLLISRSKIFEEHGRDVHTYFLFDYMVLITRTIGVEQFATTQVFEGALVFIVGACLAD